MCPGAAQNPSPCLEWLMLTSLFAYLLFAALALAAIGLALLPLALLSGLWAGWGVRRHREQACDIDRLLKDDHDFGALSADHRSKKTGNAHQASASGNNASSHTVRSTHFTRRET